VRPGWAWGVREKKSTWVEERGKKKVNLTSPPWLAQGQGGTEKSAPMSAPSLHIGALVGAGSLWPIRTSSNWRFIAKV